MKKTIAILAMGALAYGANAQETSLEAGKIAISGAIGYSSGSSETETTSGGTTVNVKGPTITNMNLVPSIQYFLSKNLSVGLGIGYTSSKISSETDFGGVKVETTVTAAPISIAPMATYYKSLGSDKFGLTVTAMLPLGFGSVKAESKSGSTTTTVESKLNSMGFTIQPGLYYFPTSKVMLTANIGNILSFTRNTTTQETGSPVVTEKESETEIEILNLNTNGGLGTGLSFGASFFF